MSAIQTNVPVWAFLYTVHGLKTMFHRLEIQYYYGFFHENLRFCIYMEIQCKYSSRKMLILFWEDQLWLWSFQLVFWLSWYLLKQPRKTVKMSNIKRTCSFCVCGPAQHLPAPVCSWWIDWAVVGSSTARPSWAPSDRRAERKPKNKRHCSFIPFRLRWEAGGHLCWVTSTVRQWKATKTD